MSRTRRLRGIAAFSAGALATVGLTSPASGVDAPGDDAAMAQPGTVPDDVLVKWESERGLDLPDDLFHKIEGFDTDSSPDGAFIKWEYQPATDPHAGLLIKYEYAPDGGSGAEPFIKWEYGLDDPAGREVVESFDGAFLKLEDAFLKLEGTDGEMAAADAFIKWEYASGAEPTADAFIKWEAAQADPASAPALIKWEYDALDLVEGALLKVEAASIEGDPDQPIVTGLLDQVRALRAPAALVNPFVERDQAMKNLPLPKKLPADAGTYALPKVGLWRSVNLPGTLKCGGSSQRLPRSVSDSVTFELADGGSTLVGYDLGEPGSKVSLTADPQIQGRFTGTLQVSQEGGRVDMDLTLQLVTDDRAVGRATIEVKAAGQTCTITRRFDMTFRGP